MKPGDSHSLLVRSKAVCLAPILIGLVTGCVDRRFIIESNVPNADVYIDNRRIGPAPAHAAFEYYGHYEITLIQPGYEPRTERVHVTAPWYGYPPFDFLTEVLWPFHIRDTRRYYFHLQEATQTRVDDLLNNAESLRDRAQHLPQPDHPAVPRAEPVPESIPAEPPGVPPGVTQPNPLVPPVGPQPGSVAPSVLPPGR